MSGSDPTTARQLREYLVSPAITAVESATSEITESLSAIRDQQQTAIQQLDEVVTNQGGAGSLSSYPYNLSVSGIPANTTENDPVIETREAPTDATITDVYFTSTQAAAQRVGAQLRTGSGRRYIPRDPDADANYIPLDADTISVTLNEEIDEGDEFEVALANNDDTDHFARVIVVLRDRP